MPKPENIEPHKFKSGESGNPNGRPKKTIRVVTDELKAAGYTAAKPLDITECYMTLINLPMDELKTRVEETSQPAMVRIVGKAILSGKGFDVLERMIDRSHGKAVQQIDISAEVTTKDIIAKAFPDPINPEDESQPEPAAPDQQ